MNDMRTTIVPKSDQLNADDLIGRTLTIKVSKVHITAEADQPVAIHYEGDAGKPYKICKSMRRVLVNCWGPDANVYVGRQMTLYRDDKVQFGGLAVGGIRISHLSNIDKEMTMALTATRASRKPYTVKPLGNSASAAKSSSPAPASPTDKWAADARERFAAADTPHDLAGLTAWWNSPDNMKARQQAHRQSADLATTIKAEFQAVVMRLTQMEGAEA